MSEAASALEPAIPTAVEDILADPPMLHCWDGQWSSGGFHPGHLSLIAKHALAVRGAGDLTIVETGAGLSTALFAALGAAKVISIAPEPELFDRIRGFLNAKGVKSACLEFHAAISEEVLPELARAHEGRVDVVLIDGGHGWPTVFVDFCYANKMLRPGGVMFIDDIQLHSVRELFELLKSQPGFILVDQLNKLVVFRKEWEMRYLPDFGGQPYIMSKPMMSFEVPKRRFLRYVLEKIGNLPRRAKCQK